jgi:hypothetical protein
MTSVAQIEAPVNPFVILPASPADTCPFCETDICSTCGGCEGTCNPFHACECWTVTDERGRIVDHIPSVRCGGCGERVPECFLSGGVCPDCR